MQTLKLILKDPAEILIIYFLGAESPLTDGWKLCDGQKMAWVKNWLKNYRVWGNINIQVFINIKGNSSECPETAVEVARVSCRYQ